MWVGNLPSKTTHAELQQFLSHSTEVVSIFVITQSNCAFVNFDSEEALHGCIAEFNGVKLRPNNPRCPNLLCRIRTKEDDERAGVGGQRQAHIHRDAVKVKDFGPGSPLVKQVVEPSRSETPSTNESSDSTSSSLLVQHFPRRFFIIKSFTPAQLEESVRTGLWTTQGRNEAPLNRAFRTSQEVILFFSANGSGAFFGYARMAGAIGNVSAKASPSEKVLRASSEPVEEHQRLETGSRSVSLGSDPVPSRPTLSSHAKGDLLSGPMRNASEPATTYGTPFRVTWLSTERLAFKKTRHITNPWTDGREVKISRDGTEVHPTAGKELLEAWEQAVVEAGQKKQRGGRRT